MTNVRTFGNQYQCVDCGAVWDVNDREPHVCPEHARVEEIPHADEVIQRVEGEMAIVKKAINGMLRDGRPTCEVNRALSPSLEAHLKARGYGVSTCNHVTLIYVA